MAVRHATSPDGREWEIGVYRFRMPEWRLSGDELDEDPLDLAWSSVRATLLLPVRVVGSFFSETRWVEARCRSPSELMIAWRTTRTHADEVADHVARQLPHGYEDLTPPGAELVEAPTRPD